jgi:hypothetical protein
METKIGLKEQEEIVIQSLQAVQRPVMYEHYTREEIQEEVRRLTAILNQILTEKHATGVIRKI